MINPNWGHGPPAGAPQVRAFDSAGRAGLVIGLDRHREEARRLQVGPSESSRRPAAGGPGPGAPHAYVPLRVRNAGRFQVVWVDSD